MTRIVLTMLTEHTLPHSANIILHQPSQEYGLERDEKKMILGTNVK